jgi:hypothetical protein
MSAMLSHPGAKPSPANRQLILFAMLAMCIGVFAVLIRGFRNVDGTTSCSIETFARNANIPPIVKGVKMKDSQRGSTRPLLPSSSTPPDCCSIDWYSEGDCREIQIGQMRITVRLVGRKGRRARLAIRAPSGAIFRSTQLESNVKSIERLPDCP